MYVFGISYVDPNGNKIKWGHKILRALITLVLYSISSYLYAAPLIINAIVMFFSPLNRSIVDIGSNMVAIDKKESIKA